MLRRPEQRWTVGLLALVMTLQACDNDGAVADQDARDVGANAVADASSDGGAGADVGPDVTPSTLGLAPAVCGAKPYAWLPSAATSTAPGALIAHEEITNFDFGAKNLSTLLGAVGVKLPLSFEHDVRVFRIRYRTQDRGAPTQATAFVALPIPKGEPLELDLVAYLHGTAGFNDTCAPSAKVLDPVAGAALASFGHIVVAPDYRGMRAGASVRRFAAAPLDRAAQLRYPRARGASS